MKIGDQNGIRSIVAGVQLPKVALVEQVFPDDSIEHVEPVLLGQFAEKKLHERIRPGMRVVLTGSSRQIDHMPEILRLTARFVRSLGGHPYIIPAMGSHGGATAEGQKAMLEALGITEKDCECPIYSSMETVRVGTLSDGDPVLMDRFAFQADAIIVIGRIKAHTAFRGQYESGLIKMLAIGLGKREGADCLHSAGYGEMARRLQEYAKIVYDNSRVIFGIALVENEYDRTCRIEVMRGEDIFEREPGLLALAKKRMPKIVFPSTDILLVREIGKNFSGAGMDPNVTGTFSTPYAYGGIEKQRTVVLDISRESHGNFLGLGMADLTTRRAFDKLETTASYCNAITDTILSIAKIPPVMETDEIALKTAVKTLVGVDKNRVRLAGIKNTLSLRTILVSEALLREVEEGKCGKDGRPLSETIRIREKPRALRFDRDGNLLDLL